jgi:hypothetical protein
MYYMFQNLKLQFNVLKSFNFNLQMYKFEMCYREMWRSSFNVLKSFNFTFQMYKFEMCYREMWRREFLGLCFVKTLIIS